ncbi:unnamed protein product [Lepidochelys kempii]
MPLALQHSWNPANEFNSANRIGPGSMLFNSGGYKNQGVCCEREKESCLLESRALSTGLMPRVHLGSQTTRINRRGHEIDALLVHAQESKVLSDGRLPTEGYSNARWPTTTTPLRGLQTATQWAILTREVACPEWLLHLILGAPSTSVPLRAVMVGLTPALPGQGSRRNTTCPPLGVNPHYHHHDTGGFNDGEKN